MGNKLTIYMLALLTWLKDAFAFLCIRLTEFGCDLNTISIDHLWLTPTKAAMTVHAVGRSFFRFVDVENAEIVNCVKWYIYVYMYISLVTFTQSSIHKKSIVLLKSSFVFYLFVAYSLSLSQKVWSHILFCVDGSQLVHGWGMTHLYVMGNGFLVTLFICSRWRARWQLRRGQRFQIVDFSPR